MKGKSKCPFCGGCKIKPFTGKVGGQNCTDCDKNGMILNSKLEEMGLYEMIENQPNKSRFTRNNLTAKEKKIYDAVMIAFPATHPETAYNVAIQGGVKFQFVPK